MNYGISEASVLRIEHCSEDILSKSKKFHLPKQIPNKDESEWYCGKNKRYTLKVQAMMHDKTDQASAEYILR